MKKHLILLSVIVLVAQCAIALAAVIPVYDLETTPLTATRVKGLFMTSFQASSSTLAVRVCTLEGSYNFQSRSWACQDVTAASVSANILWKFEVNVNPRTQGWVMVMLDGTSDAGVKQRSFVAAEYDTRSLQGFMTPIQERAFRNLAIKRIERAQRILNRSGGGLPGNTVPITYAPTDYVSNAPLPTADITVDIYCYSARGVGHALANTEFLEAPTGGAKEPGGHWSGPLPRQPRPPAVGRRVRFLVTTQEANGLYVAHIRERMSGNTHHWSGLIRQF